MKQYKVIVAEKAKTMLGAHIKFMAKVSLPAAKETKKRLLEAIRSLANMPKRFPFLDVDFIPRNKYRKMVVDSWYLVLYQVKENTVYVDYISIIEAHAFVEAGDCQ